MFDETWVGLASVSEFLRSEDCPKVKEGLQKTYSMIILAEGPVTTLEQVLTYELRSNGVVRRIWSRKKRDWVAREEVSDFWESVIEDLRFSWLVPPTVIDIDRLRASQPQPAVRKTR